MHALLLSSRRGPLIRPALAQQMVQLLLPDLTDDLRAAAGESAGESRAAAALHPRQLLVLREAVTVQNLLALSRAAVDELDAVVVPEGVRIHVLGAAQPSASAGEQRGPPAAGVRGWRAHQ